MNFQRQKCELQGIYFPHILICTKRVAKTQIQTVMQFMVHLFTRFQAESNITEYLGNYLKGSHCRHIYDNYRVTSDPY
jgi:hypothetical protein